MKRAIFAAALMFGALAAGPSQAQGMGTTIGTIIIMGAKFCPQGWLEANGRTLPISEYLDLFTVIGTTYGGNGQSTFALPQSGPLGPNKAPVKWCIAYEGQAPRAMNTPPKHK